MPILILLGIGAIYGVAALKDKSTPSKHNFENMTVDERANWTIKQNVKNVDKIVRKYKGWWR